MAPGAHLASVHPENQQAITDLIINTGRGWLWLGLRRDGGSWKWSDGSAYDVSNWATGEPNNKGGGEDCVVVYGDTGKWNDYACSDRNNFMCQLVLAV